LSRENNVETISLSGPDITEAEIDAVVAVLRTPHLSLGPKVAEFEAALARRLNVKFAVACNSGTSALHMAWRSIGLRPGDEVVTTPFSFIASANSIVYEGGRPVFVDIDPRTWQIDAGLVEAAITPRTRAVLPVDIFGSTPDWDAISAIVRRHKLRVVEDSCEALGTTRKGKPTGTFGEVGAFGFYPNKQVTTGEGGMLVTDNAEIAGLARSIRNQGRDPEAGWLAHARLGFNFRLPDINCAIGVEQLKRLDAIKARRAQVAGWYIERLRDESRLRLQVVPDEVSINWFVFVVRLSDDYTQAQRDEILKKLARRGIGCGNYFTPIHLQPFYRDEFGYKPGDFPVTEALSARTVALPFHNRLSEADVDRVTKALRELL